MRDNIAGVLLGIVAVPVMVVCCGGGLAAFVAISGGIGGWLSGLNGIGAVAVALGLFLLIRRMRHRRATSDPDSQRHSSFPNSVQLVQPRMPGKET